MAERIIASKEIFTCPICTISENTVEFPDGSHATRYFIERPAGVMMIPLTEKNEILMLREWRSAAGKKLWWLPTGLIDAGETPEEAAQRELQEEVGVRARKLTELLHDPGTSSYVKSDLRVFLAEELTPSTKAGDEHEDITVIPTPVTKVFTMMENLEIEAPIILRALLAFKKHLRERTK